MDCNFSALESLLSEFQGEIVAHGVVATLAKCEPSQAKYQELLGSHDIAAIKRYAEQFYSPLRLLALLCLEHRAPLRVKLLSACLMAGRYSDLLQLIDQHLPDDPSTAPLAIQACYRLALWPELLRHARSLDANMISTVLQLMIVRAHLQVGDPLEALARLLHVQPQTDQELRQLEILRLLARCRSGLFPSADLRLFLRLFPNCTRSELAALATLWSAAEVHFTPLEIASSTLTLALRQFWQGLCQPTLLVAGSELVPTLTRTASIERLAVLVADISYLPLYEQLLEAILAQNKGVQAVHLLVLNPVDRDIQSSVSCLDLHGLSVPEMLLRLRQLQLDVILDTVGSKNSRWLEVVAQRVAAVQIGWVSPNLAYLQSPFYEALIVDRWTQPPEVLQPQVKLLQVSGLAILSHPAVLPQPAPREQAAPVGHPQLVLLGSPDQLLPGTAGLLRQILALDSALTISFLDPSWTPDLLAAWWSADQVYPVPASLRLLTGIETLQSLDPRCFIGLSLNQTSPTVSALQLVSLGIPIVCLVSSLQGIQPMRSLLEALGLQSFLANDKDYFLAILSELLANSALRAELSEAIPAQLARSLVMEADQFASDLLQGLLLLKHTA